MKRLLFLSTFILALLVVPVFVFAQTFAEFVYGPVTTLVRYLTYLVFALTLVLFLWGLAKFILKAEDPGEREKGRQLMVWGLIGMFVMFSVMGIVYMIRGALFGGGAQIFYPTSYFEEVKETDTNLTLNDQR